MTYRPLCLALALSFVYLLSEAQTFYPRIGLTASVNSYRSTRTPFPATPSYDMKPRVGFTLGVGYGLKLSEVISVQAELNFIQKSFESNYSGSISIHYGDGEVSEFSGKGSDQYAISYLEMPLLVRARVFHDNLFVLGGFSIGMGLGGSHKYTYDRTYYSNVPPRHEEGSGKIKFGDESATTGEDTYFDNRWDVGPQVGIGLVLKKIQLECRYGLGLVDINKDYDSKNQCLQFSFAVPIQLKQK